MIKLQLEDHFAYNEALPWKNEDAGKGCKESSKYITPEIVEKETTVDLI